MFTYRIPSACNLSYFDAIDLAFNYGVVPEGYDLVEKEDHKKERLEKERENLTARKKMLLNLLDEVNNRFEEIKKELK